MRTKIFALFAAFVVMFGIGLVGASSAQAVGELGVSNSAYSTGSILVCGSGYGNPTPCRWVAPGGFTIEYNNTQSSWKPQNVAVGAGWCVLYRVVSGTGYGAWRGACGGTTGTWVYVGDWSYATFEFIIDYHG